MFHKFPISLFLLLILLVTMCSACAHLEKLDENNLNKLFVSTGVPSPWKVEQDILTSKRPFLTEDGSEIHSRLHIYAYGQLEPLNEQTCSSRIFEFSQDHPERQPKLVVEKPFLLIALKPCDSTKLSDLISLPYGFEKESLLEVASVLREAIPIFGGNPKNVRYKDPALECVFAQLTEEQFSPRLILNYEKRKLNVSFKMSRSAGCYDDMLGVEITSDESGHVTDIFVDRVPGWDPG